MEGEGRGEERRERLSYEEDPGVLLFNKVMLA